MVDLSVIFVTYNRSTLLSQTIESLRDVLKSTRCSYELIVADDCSSAEHQLRIDSIPDVSIVRTACNRGLGANVNNGFAQSRGRMILQIQDDWICISDTAFLTATMDFLRRNADVGIVQLTLVGTDLAVERRTISEFCFQVFRNDQCPWTRRCGVRPYSDQPHIKRREFVLGVGGYLESVPMASCENDYKHRVANQARWKVAMIEGGRFVHIGAGASFNTGARRHSLVDIIQRLPWGKTFIEPTLRNLVRRIDHVAAKLLSR